MGTKPPSTHSFAQRALHSIIWISLLFILYTKAESCDEPGLQCWLQNLPIPLSDTTLTNNQATLFINQTTCDLNVPSVSSSIPSPLTIDISANNIGINCTGYWLFTSPNETVHGILGVIITGASVEIAIPLNSSGFVVSLVDPYCNVQIPTLSLDFHNDSASSILNQFVTAVQSNMTNEIITTTSTLILNTTETQVQQMVSNSNAGVQGIVDSNILGPPGPPVLPPIVGGNVDLTANPIMGLINWVLNGVVGINGTIGINNIVNFVTNNTGAFSFNYGNSSLIQGLPTLVSFYQNISSDFGLEIKPLWVNITGLNTFVETSFASPIDNQTLRTSTLMENLGLVVEFEANVSLFNSDQGSWIAQRSVFRTNLQHAQMSTDFNVVLNKIFLEFLTPNQLLIPSCFANSLSSLQVNDFNISFLMEDISVSSAAGQVETPTVALVNSGIETFAESYGSVVSDLIFDQLWSLDPISLYTLNWDIPQLQNMSLTKFPCIPKFDGPTLNKVATIYAAVAAVGCFFLLALVAYLIVRLYEAREEDPLIGDVHRTRALMLNPGLPFLVRYGVVLVLLINIAMFIASNASVGASVYLVARSGESSTMFPSLFNFSLINSVRDMWNAKVYALSILIALFSGVWPYTKLVLLLVCWCSPARLVNLQWRGRILIMLDAMGKWSLIDSFVLILMMVAFHFTLAPPVTEMTPEGSIVFKAYVEPHFGFYSFLIATMLSLVITHFVIKMHDLSLEREHSESSVEGKEALWSHASSGTQYRAAYLLTIVTVLLCISGVLVAFGISIKSFEFSFHGAFGVLLKFLDNPDTLSFSVVSLGRAFPHSSIEPDSLGTRFIQVSFFIFAVAMPIAYVFCLLVLWMVPLTYKFQSRLLTITATIHAWSALEVFVISIIAALLELQQFAQFIIGNKCDMINKFLRTPLANGLLHGDDKCFDVEATLKTGCWVLFAACAIYVLVGSLVVRGCHNALKVRLERPPTLN